MNKAFRLVWIAAAAAIALALALATLPAPEQVYENTVLLPGAALSARARLTVPAFGWAGDTVDVSFSLDAPETAQTLSGTIVAARLDVAGAPQAGGEFREPLVANQQVSFRWRVPVSGPSQERVALWLSFAPVRDSQEGQGEVALARQVSIPVRTVLGMRARVVRYLLAGLLGVWALSFIRWERKNRRPALSRDEPAP